MKQNVQNNWSFILQLPSSARNYQIDKVKQKYKTYLSNDLVVQNNKQVCEYKIPFQFYFESLQDYWKISHINNTEYYIEIGKNRFDKFSQGHHCYFTKYKNYSKNNTSLCYEGYYGRISLGCIKIPLFESIHNFNQYRKYDFIINRKQLFWYQVGYTSGDAWIINKKLINKIVTAHIENVIDCPIIDTKKIKQTINNLPDHIAFTDPRFHFEPLSRNIYTQKITGSHLINSETNIKTNFIVTRRNPNTTKDQIDFC